MHGCMACAVYSLRFHNQAIINKEKANSVYTNIILSGYNIIICGYNIIAISG